METDSRTVMVFILVELQKMKRSFVDLLNEDSNLEFEEMMFSQSQPQRQPQTQPEKEGSKLRKGRRSKKFLIEEDLLLISGWLNVSMDPVQGNNQTHTCYWNRIWNYYEENKEGLESDRSTNSLCNRWCTINEKVAKFIGFYNQIFERNQSGLSEQDKIIYQKVASASQSLINFICRICNKYYLSCSLVMS